MALRPNRQGVVAVVSIARILLLAAAGFAVTGCGSLDHYQSAPDRFNVWGDGLYARETDVQREAKRVCPDGYTKLSEDYSAGPAELGHTLFWRIACNESTK